MFGGLSVTIPIHQIQLSFVKNTGIKGRWYKHSVWRRGATWAWLLQYTEESIQVCIYRCVYKLINVWDHSLLLLCVLFADISSPVVFTFLNLKVSATGYENWKETSFQWSISSHSSNHGTSWVFCLFLIEVVGIHPECKIFQQVVKEEALCLERNDSLSPDLKGNSPDC